MLALNYDCPPTIVQPDTTNTTITLSGNQIISTEVRFGQFSNINLSNIQCLAVWAITVNNSPDIGRSFLQFDYSSLPSSSKIFNATLYLYGDTTQVEVGHVKGATEYSGPNNWEIYSVTSAWDASTITWNNQPGYTTVNSINMPATTSTFENYSIDITTLAHNEVSNPSSSFGIVMMQALEVPYRGLAFYNVYGPPGLQPKLVIKYK